jgi:hypothetical protein
MAASDHDDQSSPHSIVDCNSECHYRDDTVTLESVFALEQEILRQMRLDHNNAAIDGNLSLRWGFISLAVSIAAIGISYVFFGYMLLGTDQNSFGNNTIILGLIAVLIGAVIIWRVSPQQPRESYYQYWSGWQTPFTESRSVISLAINFFITFWNSIRISFLGYRL